MKLIAWILAGVVLLLGLLLGAVLVPPHLQIRALEIDIPVLEDITSLPAPAPGTGPVSMKFVTTAEQDTPLGTLGHVGMLVSWPDNRTLLIDAGMDREAAEAFGKPFEQFYGAGPTLAHGPVEEQLGSAVHEIRAIAFTHLHSDHTSGITAICDAQQAPATIFQTTHQASEQNHLTSAGQQLVESSSCTRQVLSDERLKPLPGFPGVHAIEAGGHTPGSTVFVVNLPGQTWILAGDLTNAMENIRNNEGKGWAYSYLLVPEDTVLLERWRRWLKAAEETPGFSVAVAHDLAHLRSGALEEVTVRE